MEETAQILVPYRAREEQLKRFINHMTKYMAQVHSNINYKIIIIEQDNEYPFNRGILLNIGFLEREKEDNNNYYIHHNCDLFPEIDFTPKLDYSSTSENKLRDIYGYGGGIGGIAIFNKKTFLKVNGFPNDYFNWGAEDTALFNRCVKNGIEILRQVYNKGINEENHTRDSSLHSINQEKCNRDNPESNGLTTCKYTCKINTDSQFGKDENNVIHYLIDFEYN